MQEQISKYKGSKALHGVQATSTFAFAVLYSSLSLYLIKQLGLSNTQSNSIVGLFMAFNYVLHLLGGVMGGCLISNRSLYLWTTFLQTIGMILMAFIREDLLIPALSLFLVGCGINTTCFNNILTQLYSDNDSLREQAFFWNYSAMNVGFFAGFMVSGFYDGASQYQHLFYIASITNLVCMGLLLSIWAKIKDRTTTLADITDPKRQKSRNIMGFGITLILIPALMLAFRLADISNMLIIIGSAIVLFGILITGMRLPSQIEKKKIKAFLILTLSSIIFWMVYYTGPMGITMFIKHNVNKELFGFTLPTQWILNINSVLIIAGSPLLATVLLKLKARGINLSTSTQFIGAFGFMAMSFLFLRAGIWFADSLGVVSLIWYVLHGIMLALAELLIGPVGYAMIGKISPAKMQGVLMGTWMMVSGVSSSLSHYFSNSMMKSDSIDPLVTNPDYAHVFIQLTLWSALGAIFLYILSSRLKGVIETTKDKEPIPTT